MVVTYGMRFLRVVFDQTKAVVQWMKGSLGTKSLRLSPVRDLLLRRMVYKYSMVYITVLFLP